VCVALILWLMVRGKAMRESLERSNGDVKVGRKAG
jgi:hypothetical protein